MRRTIITVALATVVATTTIGAVAGASPQHKQRAAAARANVTRLNLTPSSDQLAKCMPKAHVKLKVYSTVDDVGIVTEVARRDASSLRGGGDTCFLHALPQLAAMRPASAGQRTHHPYGRRPFLKSDLRSFRPRDEQCAYRLEHARFRALVVTAL